VPPDINTLIEATNRGIQAIPQDNLKTAIDEAYRAVGGLGPEISRLVKGSTALAIDARTNLDALTTLADQSQPVLDSQTNTSDSIHAWASNLASVTQQLKSRTRRCPNILSNGPAAAEESRALLDRLQPSLPILLANLVSLDQVGLTYQDNLEQLSGPAAARHRGRPGRDPGEQKHQAGYSGGYLSFNLNLTCRPLA
jgi:phospholipid/cholesterol/gamma-HCH transport system substrate-binding protein